MTVKFYLKRSKPLNKPTAVFALLNYNYNSLKIYTGESIPPRFWNKATHLAKANSGFEESPEFNQRLVSISSTMNKVFLDYRNNHNHEMPAPAVLKPLIEIALKKGSVKTTFLHYFNDFVERSFGGQRLDPKSSKPIRHGVAKGYKTTYNHLTDFASQWKRKLDFETIDLEFHADFTKYLCAAPRLLSSNSIGSHIQRIKAVLAEATARGVNNNQAFKSRYFVKQTEEADTIYLNTEELNEMKKLDLSDNPRLDNVRDLFLIGCYTGLRFSDYTILKPKHISDGFIRIIQIKTGKPIVIPVHSVVKTILKKYNGETPRSISNVKVNAYLKELGEMMPSLQKIEIKTITKGGTKVIKSVKKWELLTSHTARRSFATNEFNAGTPTLTIAAITGHLSESSFLKYIRVTPDEHAQKIKVLWDARAAKVVKMKKRV